MPLPLVIVPGQLGHISHHEQIHALLQNPIGVLGADQTWTGDNTFVGPVYYDDVVRSRKDVYVDLNYPNLGGAGITAVAGNSAVNEVGNSAALAGALLAVSAGIAQKVRVPPGVWCFAADTPLNVANLEWEGSAYSKTPSRLKQFAGGRLFAVTVGNIVSRGLEFVGAPALDLGDGVAHFQFHECQFEANANSPVFKSSDNFWMRFYNCDFLGAGYGSGNQSKALTPAMYATATQFGNWRTNTFEGCRWFAGGCDLYIPVGSNSQSVIGESVFRRNDTENFAEDGIVRAGAEVSTSEINPTITRVAQKFTSYGEAYVAAARLKTPSGSIDCDIRIETDTGTEPSGTLAAAGLIASGVTITAADTLITFASPTVLPAGTYWLVATRIAGSASFQGANYGVADRVKSFASGVWTLEPVDNLRGSIVPDEQVNGDGAAELMFYDARMVLFNLRSDTAGPNDVAFRHMLFENCFNFDALSGIPQTLPLARIQSSTDTLRLRNWNFNTNGGSTGTKVCEVVGDVSKVTLVHGNLNEDQASIDGFGWHSGDQVLRRTSTGLTIGAAAATRGKGYLDARVRKLLGPWAQDDVAANLSFVAVPLYGDTTRSRIPMMRDGSVTGIIVRSSAARTAGTLTITLRKNGAAVAMTAVLDATNTTYKITQERIGSKTYVAGDELSVLLTTDAAWTPVTADITVMLEVYE